MAGERTEPRLAFPGLDESSHTVMTVSSLNPGELLESDSQGALEPESRTWKSRGEEVFEMLRGAILGGALGPGEELRLEELCRASGTSRIPIREALAQLHRIGLVELSPRRTARVAALSPADFRDVFDTRLIVEVAAISAAATEISDEDIASAQGWLKHLRDKLDEGDQIAARRAHEAFHFALYRARCSRWLLRQVQPLWCSSERYRQAYLGSTCGLLEAETDEHERLLAAWRAGEADVAATELWNHLVRTGNLVACSMGGIPLYEQRSVPPSARSTRF